jgi:hypothetical protein
MKRRCAFCLSLAIGITPLLAQEPSPDAGSFEVEPPLLVQPDGKPVVSEETNPVPNLDVAQLEKRLDRAKKSAASADRLYKAGVLSKVEAEQRALRVLKIEVEFANAQLAELQKTTPSDDAIVQTGGTQSTREELKRALAAAHEAAVNLAKAELDAAVLNLQRQQKLLALGSAHKSDVVRAEEKLAALKRDQ